MLCYLFDFQVILTDASKTIKSPPRPVIFGYILNFTWASLKLEAKLIHLAYIFGSTCPDCCSPNYCLAATCSWEKVHKMLCSLCSSARDVLFFSLCYTSVMQLSHSQRCLKFLRYTSLQPWSMALPHATVRLIGFQPFNSSVWVTEAQT